MSRTRPAEIRSKRPMSTGHAHLHKVTIEPNTDERPRRMSLEGASMSRIFSDHAEPMVRPVPRRQKSLRDHRDLMKELSETESTDVQSHSFSGFRKRRKERLYKTPSLRARVPRTVLEGGNAGPFRQRFLTRMARALRPNPAVKVETLHSGLSASVLYAPEESLEGEVFVPTALVSGKPSSDDNTLVYRDSAFEIRVAGMFVESFDRFNGDNELLLYSIQTDPNTAGDANQSLPFIHFDYNRDATLTSERPNTYLPIPASKSYVMSSKGCNKVKSKIPDRSNPPSLTPFSPMTSACPSPSPAMRGLSKKKEHVTKERKSVNVQFRILEMDKPSQTIRDAVSGIDDLGGFVSGFATAAPFLGVLTPALSMVSSVSKRALDSYAEPEKIVSIDMDFLLADRKRVASGNSACGEYLRYGYYFFLAEPVEGKLWASVRTPKNVQLMLKRCDGEYTRGERIEARKYFPLTDVSYLVVRVVEPTDTVRYNRKPIQMNHAHMLEDLFKRSKPGRDESDNVRNALYQLGREMGVLDSDSDEDQA